MYLNTDLAKQLYLRVERREHVFSDLLALTFCSLVFRINIQIVFI